MSLSTAGAAMQCDGSPSPSLLEVFWVAITAHCGTCSIYRACRYVTDLASTKTLPIDVPSTPLVIDYFHLVQPEDVGGIIWSLRSSVCLCVGFTHWARVLVLFRKVISLD